MLSVQSVATGGSFTPKSVGPASCALSNIVNLDSALAEPCPVFTHLLLELASERLSLSSHRGPLGRTHQDTLSFGSLCPAPGGRGRTPHPRSDRNVKRRWPALSRLLEWRCAQGHRYRIPKGSQVMNVSSVAVSFELALAIAACGNTPAVNQPPSTLAAGPTAVGAPKIGALAAADVTPVLSSLGLACSGPAIYLDGKEWICSQDNETRLHDVRIYTDAAGNVREIVASTFGPAADTDGKNVEELSLPLFVALAGLNYYGADTEKATAWIEDHLGGGNEKFGAVAFDLTASDNYPDGPGRLLRIQVAH
jgi:hypothetical protein